MRIMRNASVAIFRFSYAHKRVGSVSELKFACVGLASPRVGLISCFQEEKVGFRR